MFGCLLTLIYTNHYHDYQLVHIKWGNAIGNTIPARHHGNEVKQAGVLSPILITVHVYMNVILKDL